MGAEGNFLYHYYYDYYDYDYDYYYDYYDDDYYSRLTVLTAETLVGPS